ncbi:response regulator [Thiomicrorhabdus sp. Milos-T2]|uniref:response regulator n=1 Tax=Thiomicrorhabdus sp. Milos-T2 TaxID=90814 RepID=UPI000493C629|nr:response regulator [Thiomicrorhabdus sp. Milos-T2]
MKKLLYVDDASSMRKLVNLVLAKDFDITLAENGLQGYEAIEKQQFDVIVSDVNMPVMTGIELLEKLRAHPNSKFTPVLMLTTEASSELKAEGKRLGATGWIVKPFDPEKLSSVINRVLN